jgi:hypothetical protein
MATKDEVIEAIRRGQEKVHQTFGSLNDAQLRQVVHEGDGGWTAKEVLAHLAGRAQGYQRTLQTASGNSQPAPAGFNVDHWNRERVAERIHKSRDELLAEFDTVHDDLIEQVRGLSDEQLAKLIRRPTGEMPLSETLARSGGQHSINHSEEVERALGQEQSQS